MNLEIFLAGSTTLNKQRDIIRNQIMMWNANRNLNDKDVVFNVYTFENFDDAISDKSTGQPEYNKFIRERADIAIFVLYDEINEKTREEFDVAYESLQSKRKAPDLIVFSHKSSLSKEIENIREKLKSDGKYFKEYSSDDDLKNSIGKILDKYVSRKKEEVRIQKQIIVRNFFILFAIICIVGVFGFARFSKRQECVERMRVALEKYESNSSNLEYYINLRSVKKEYDDLGFSKDDEIYKKIKDCLKID